MIQISKKIFSFYKINVAVLLPLLIITGIALFVKHIPYLNLYADLVITIIMIIDWLVILWISKIKTVSMIQVASLIFLSTLVPHHLKLAWHTEVVANFSYIIFATAIIFEIIKLIKNKD